MFHLPLNQSGEKVARMLPEIYMMSHVSSRPGLLLLSYTLLFYVEVVLKADLWPTFGRLKNKMRCVLRRNWIFVSSHQRSRDETFLRCGKLQQIIGLIKSENLILFVCNNEKQKFLFSVRLETSSVNIS